jgi:signal transduction histidine kinase
MKVDAFGSDVKSLAQLLCECAADALIRLRTKHFMLNVSRLFGSVTTEAGSQTSDTIRRFVELIFALTGAAELQYLTQADGQWLPERGFVYPGQEMDPRLFKKWRDHITTHWRGSYIHSVIYGPNEAAWTHNQRDILSDRNLRDGVETQTQAVLWVRPGDNSPVEAVFVLYFLHRNAMNDSLLELLRIMVRALAQLLDDRRRVATLYGVNSIREQEALFRVNEYLSASEQGSLRPEEAFDRIRAEVAAMATQIDRNKGMIKVPNLRRTSVKTVWDRAREKLAATARTFGSRIAAAKGALGSVNTDPDILEDIFFNLIDNALRHGGLAITVEIDRAPDRGELAVFHVIDSGKGFARSARAEFGKPGTSTDPDSTGMGIYLSAHRAGDLGGELALESSDPGCTRIVITLPRVGSAR